MDCRDVLDRLAALEDEELGPSEDVLVRQHLRFCEACATVQVRMGATVPRPGLIVPAGIQERLSRLNGESVARGDRARVETPRSLLRPLLIPAPAAIGYAALLAVAIAWGTANWIERSVLEARLAPPPGPTAAAPEIPADDYRPAAWSPGAPPK